MFMCVCLCSDTKMSPFSLLFFLCLKGRLSELVSQIRLQRQLTTSRADTQYQIDPLMMEEVKQVGGS